MKKIFFLFAVVLPLQVFSQTRIDQLKSDSAVIRFVKNYSDEHRLRFDEVDFEQRSLFLQKDLSQEDLLFMDSLLGVKWIVHDFNNDKKKDLIFNGRIGKHQAVIIAFISDADSVKHVQLGHIYGNHYPQSISLYNNEYLISGHIPNDGFDKSWNARLKNDTLTWRFGGFIEYQPAKEKSSFDSLSYTSRSPWMGITPRLINIYRDGSARYTGTHFRTDIFNGKKTNVQVAETFTKNINKAQLKELQQLISWIGFARLKDNYSLPNIFDLSTAYTMIYLKGGPAKKIEDYGMEGSYGLRLLYSKLFQLTTEKNWFLLRARTIRAGAEGPGFL
jgi:hypothetical protein